jgi:hypothetical protein
MKKNQFLLFGCIVAMALFSCSDEHAFHVDLHEPGSGQTFSIGDDIHCDFSIHSNSELTKYTIDIHGSDSLAWEYSFESPTVGTSVDIHRDIPIPASTTPGEYHMEVWAYAQDGDSAGAEVHFNVIQ